MSTAEQKRAARRRPLPGFPKTEPFRSQKDLELYLSAEKVQCLLCGRHFANLGTHVNTLHKIKSDDYKKRFGIPLSYGLLSENSRESNSRIISKLSEEEVKARKRECDRKYREKNRELLNKKQKQRRFENYEQYLEMEREYGKTYREKYRDRVRKLGLKWYHKEKELNPQKMALLSIRNAIRRQGKDPSDYPEELLQAQAMLNLCKRQLREETL